MALLEKLRLPADTQVALFHTRYNDVLYDGTTRDTQLGLESNGGYYRNGIQVSRRGESEFRVESWTIENGFHTFSFLARLDAHGLLKDGSVNCFSLGILEMDQGYIDEFLREVSDTPIEWDEIRRRPEKVE